MHGQGRAMVFGGAVLGFCGVAAAASSAHAGGDPRLMGAVALVCLAHAPAMLALGFWGGTQAFFRIGGLLLLLGAVLFSADLALRALYGSRLFPMAAPAGGITMMAGWLAVGIAALTSRR